jgi:hypothetical protein
MAELYFANEDAAAASHGALYTTRIGLREIDGGTRLSMTFNGEAPSVGAKIVWALTGWMTKGYVKKALATDFTDTTAAVEA